MGSFLIGIYKYFIKREKDLQKKNLRSIHKKNLRSIQVVYPKILYSIT